MDLSALKSGSDIRGTAIGSKEEVNLSGEAVYRVGLAFCSWLATRTGKRRLRVAVGHDSRLSAESIKTSLLRAFEFCRVEVFDCGLATTPSMFFLTKHEEALCDGSIMITASHHPFDKNGLKFFTREGGVSKEELSDIIGLAEEGKYFIFEEFILNKKSYLQAYSKTLTQLVKQKTGLIRPLKGLKIVLDASNGAGGFFEEMVLRELGADTAGSVNLSPDGNFPSHTPNPEDKNAIKFLSDCTKKNKADLGIIFDTDVDRAAIALSSGREINRNALVALAAAELLEEEKGLVIVTDSVTSEGLAEFIKGLGGVHFRYKRGYQNVISKAKELVKEGKKAHLAIETSGHAAYFENDFLDDGAYLIARLLALLANLNKQGKGLESLISTLAEPLETAEIRIYCHNKINASAYMEEVINELSLAFEKQYKLVTPNFEGVRVRVEKHGGWFLLRPSVHDPNMVLNIESNKKGGVKNIAKIVFQNIKKFDKLDITQLKAFIEV